MFDVSVGWAVVAVRYFLARAVGVGLEESGETVDEISLNRAEMKKRICS